MYVQRTVQKSMPGQDADRGAVRNPPAPPPQAAAAFAPQSHSHLPLSHLHMSWHTTDHYGAKLKAPLDPVSSKSLGLLQAEQKLGNEAKREYPYKVANVPEDAGPYAARFYIFTTDRAFGMKIQEEGWNRKSCDCTNAFRWPLLAVNDSETGDFRCFIGMPRYRSRVVMNYAFDDRDRYPTVVYDWRTVRNCFSSISPCRPQETHTVVVKLSERLWKMFFGPSALPDVDDGVEEMWNLTECLTRTVGGRDNNRTIYDAEALLADRDNVLKKRICV